MKVLTLIRHARAGWPSRRLPDDQRALDENGHVEAAEMARRFARKTPRPTLFVSSPARRAIETTAVIARELGSPLPRLLQEQEVYEASATDLLRTIHSLDENEDHVVLCGHNPSLANLTHVLTGELLSLPTCAIARIKLFVDHWPDVSAGCGTLVDFDSP